MTTITICMGSSCFARGNGEHLAYIEEYLKQHHLEAVVDLRGCRCRGECAHGPCIDINDTSYRKVDAGVLRDLMELHIPAPTTAEAAHHG